MKNNRKFSAYNFRNKNHADMYEKNGMAPKGTPSIYNKSALEFIVNKLKT